MGATRRRDALKARCESGKPTRLVRSLGAADAVDGIVLEVQKDWVLLQRLADFHLDGWSAVRLDTVAEVRGTGNGKAVGRALKLHDEHPSAILVDLSSTGEIIRTMARWSPLVTVHREAQYPDSCWIGRPLRVTDKVVELLQVDSRAEWDDDPDRFKLRDLTQIEIGGRYEQALHELAGEPPVA